MKRRRRLSLGCFRLFWLGADMITLDGSIINKTGSYLAALAGRDMGKPVYVIADTWKVTTDTDIEKVVLEEGPKKLVWPERPELCRNVTFEPVPASLITGYITEKGLLSVKEIRET